MDKPRKKIFAFYKSKPKKEFITDKLLPIFNIKSLTDGTQVFYNKKEAEEGIENIQNELTYANFVLNKVKNNKIQPITILRHHLQLLDYAIYTKEKVIGRRKLREYILVDKTKPNYEIKNENVTVTFD
jgi:hypothetical protein